MTGGAGIMRAHVTAIIAIKLGAVNTTRTFLMALEVHPGLRDEFGVSR